MVDWFGSEGFANDKYDRAPFVLSNSCRWRNKRRLKCTLLWQLRSCLVCSAFRQEPFVCSPIAIQATLRVTSSAARRSTRRSNAIPSASGRPAAVLRGTWRRQADTPASRMDGHDWLLAAADRRSQPRLPCPHVRLARCRGFWQDARWTHAERLRGGPRRVFDGEEARECDACRLGNGRVRIGALPGSIRH